MKRTITILSVLVAIVLLPGAFAEYGGNVDLTEIKFPSWVKNTAGWYADKSVDDGEFAKIVQYLVDEDIIEIPKQVIFKEIEIIKEVQAEPMADDHVELWKQINFNRDELLATAQHNYSQDIWDRLDQNQIQINEAKANSHDALIKVNCMESGQCMGFQTDAPTIDYEQKYNELLDLYQRMGERVVALEKEHLK